MNATQDGPMCLQKNYLEFQPQIQGQEDCLYLNVYTPSVSHTACSGWIRCASCTSALSFLMNGYVTGIALTLSQNVVLCLIESQQAFLLTFVNETQVCKIFFNIPIV